MPWRGRGCRSAEVTAAAGEMLSCIWLRTCGLSLRRKRSDGCTGVPMSQLCVCGGGPDVMELHLRLAMPLVVVRTRNAARWDRRFLFLAPARLPDTQRRPPSICSAASLRGSRARFSFLLPLLLLAVSRFHRLYSTLRLSVPLPMLISRARSLTLTAAVPCPGLFMSRKISH